MTNSAASNAAPETNLYPQGFLALRNGIFDHLGQSLFTPNEWMVYTVLLHQCDWRFGLWNGCADRIKAAIGHTMTLPQVRRALRGLERKRYVRSYYQQGYKGNYFIAIHKYLVPVGDLKGKYLNAMNSSTYKSLVYDEKCEKDVTEMCGVSDVNVRRMSRECDPYIYQEYKKSRLEDVQEAQEGVVGVVGNPHSLSSEPEPAGNDTAILLEARKLFEQYNDAYNDTPKQRHQLLAYARQFGPDALLNAFELWSRWDASEQTQIGAGETLTCPLVKFLKPDAVEHYVQKARAESKWVQREQKYQEAASVQ